MRNLKKGDLVRIVIDIEDEDVDWLSYCTTDDVNALWDNEGAVALVLESGRDWVSLSFPDNSVARRIATRHVRFVSSL